MTNQKPRSAMTVSEYLQQQQDKHRLARMDVDIVHLKQRQDRQAGWIILLMTIVFVLASSLLFLLKL